MTRESSKSLCDLSIKTMKAGDKELVGTGKHIGLRVYVGKTGKKSFIYRYRHPMTKKLKQIKIGTYPQLTLAKAYVELEELKAIRAQGVCPAEKRKNERKQNEIDAESTFDSITIRDVARYYLSESIERRASSKGDDSISDSRRREAIRTLEKDITPEFGVKSALSLLPSQVTQLVKQIIEDRNSRVQAGRFLGELSLAYDFSIGMGYLPEDFANPCITAKKSLKLARYKLTSNKRQRVLDDDELKQLLDWLPRSKFSTHHKGILRLALWTGCRTGELCIASWDDIDLDRGVYRLKTSKNGKGRNVQLSRQAIEFLKGLRVTTDKYLFPSQRTGNPIQQKQMSEQAWQLREKGWMIDLEPWTAHDLRRTVRTKLSALGCPHDVAETILGHELGGVAGVYNVHKYEEESKAWLQKWADYLDELALLVF
ncbi:hypothetical protein A1OQ_13520 [Enterovibrio norvegicus FF-162]|uniref:tyrosine-type recombinase/integrase n=1 Tax=Enterovibrio TaxID=188143 RepID=UPI0002EB814C|nr:site-specific integrase [Enterovibrio norvegicus]OEE88353.1 hypothetical protein A1OQ_13520 [Enterovibrio norvegicus FF-162]